MPVIAGKTLPRSLYAETARPPIAAPPYEGEGRTSVAVVGAGYTGLSTALHLAEAGIDVTVLEAHEPGWGASGRNGGQVNPGVYPDPDQVAADLGAEAGRRLLDFSADAPNTVFELVRRHGIDCEAEQTGTLRAAGTTYGMGRIRQIHEQWQRRRLPAEWRDAAAMSGATGTGRYRGGVFHPQGGKVNPLGYARGLADAAQRAGARIHGASPALKLAKAGSGWRVETTRGALQAERLVIATNGYTDGLWPGLDRSIVPVYSAIVASEPLPDAIARQVMPGRSVLFEVGRLTVYYRLDRENRLLMGGRCPSRDISDLRALRYLSNYAGRLWPALEGVRWTHGWNGQLAITPDHYPHCHEPAENVHVCLGYNGRGVAMATAMGQVLARRIGGARPEELPLPITAIKEMAFHPLWRPAVAIRVAYGRIRDRLDI